MLRLQPVTASASDLGFLKLAIRVVSPCDGVCRQVSRQPSRRSVLPYRLRRYRDSRAAVSARLLRIDQTGRRHLLLLVSTLNPRWAGVSRVLGRLASVSGGARITIRVMARSILSALGVDRGELERICDRYGIAELWVFGSAARGSMGPGSDVDLLYRLQPGARLGWEIEDLNVELDALFGRHVDLVAAKSLHPLLREPVQADARALYAA